MIGIISCGAGNIGSISRIIKLLGYSCEVISSSNDINKCSKLILPGVGHFSEGMNNLRKLGFDRALNKSVLVDKVPILGICLGMQLFCLSSEEGCSDGLGFIDAQVKKFKFPDLNGLKVPHMSWSEVRGVGDNALFPHSIIDEQRFYFVHSYFVEPTDSNIITGIANYGGDFCAAFQKNNIFGVQFHPEKSHRFGKALIKRFMEM